MVSDSETILTFWFSDESRPNWFRRSGHFDDTLRQRFLQTYQAAADGQLASWIATPRGALALVITLDQLPRNLFRGTAAAFASDDQALQVACDAVERGFDESLHGAERAFLYMPFMHSERLADQQRAVELFSTPGLQDNLPHAEEHRDIIVRFGRFPHRNAVLGRTTSAEEQAYLDSPGAFRG